MDKKQVNNLIIKYNKVYDKWQVSTFNKVVLEEFNDKSDAIQWAKDTKDFIKK